VPETWEVETLEDFVQDRTTPSNESSVVQYANIHESKLLLTADAGVNALNEAADYAAVLGIPITSLTFVQIPHHGSRRNVSRLVLNRLLENPFHAEQRRQKPRMHPFQPGVRHTRGAKSSKHSSGVEQMSFPRTGLAFFHSNHLIPRKWVWLTTEPRLQ
jgi:hypothetical protein